MAINYSNKQYERALKIAYGKYYPKNRRDFGNKLLGFVLYYFTNFKWSLFNFKNYLIQFFYRVENSYQNTNFDINKNIFFEEHSNNLKNKGYTFIEDFLDKNSHDILLKKFPKFSNFRRSKKITKNYFFCYNFKHNMKVSEIKNINYNQEYKKFIQFLSSEKFIQILNNCLFKDKVEFFLANYSNSYKKSGSFLIPHMDSVSNSNSLTKNSYNLIYFIDGNNEFPKYSAGTGIYADNDFKKPLLEPSTLTNSCLIYKTDTSGNFFHGFEKVRENGFAKVCTMHYLSI